MKKLILSALAVGVMFVSCDKNDDKPTPTPERPVEVLNLDNAFSSLEIITKNLGGNASVTTVDLVSSYDANLKPYVAEGDQAMFKELIGTGTTTKTASATVAGMLGNRLVNERGVEIGQIIKKGLIGSFQLNGFNKAMMAAVMSNDKENRQKALDNAVAFLFEKKANLDISVDDPKLKSINEFTKYVRTVNSNKSDALKGIGEKLVQSLKDAYENVGDKAKFNKNISDANNYAVTIVAARCVYYLSEGSAKLSKGVNDDSVHETSEGLGFAHSLQYAYNEKEHGQFYMTKTESDELTGLNFWDNTQSAEKLEDAARKIAEKFGFTVADAKKYK